VVNGTAIAYHDADHAPLSSAKIEELNQKLSAIITNQLQSINTKEATLFSKVITYCDIDGQKEIINHGDVRSHTQEIAFEKCQEPNIQQDGLITITYHHADEDGRFPQSLSLTANEEYTFNHTELTQETTIEVANIHYDQTQLPDSLELTISGEVHIDHAVYTLQNFKQQVRL